MSCAFPFIVEALLPWGLCLLWCVCDAAVVAFWWRRDHEIQIRRGEYYVSIKVICLCLLVLSIKCQRSGADIVFIGFHVTVKPLKHFFFLTIDNIAFDHFPLSLITLTLHISKKFSRFYFKKFFCDNCQFLFRKQSSLVRFLIMCFFFYFRFSVFS